MQTKILQYIQAQFELNEEEARDTWIKVESDVSKFAKERELDAGSTEYLSLTKWYVKALLGESTSPRLPIIKSFKQFLLENYHEQF